MIGISRFTNRRLTRSQAAQGQSGCEEPPTATEDFTGATAGAEANGSDPGPSQGSFEGFDDRPVTGGATPFKGDGCFGGSVDGEEGGGSSTIMEAQPPTVGEGFLLGYTDTVGPNQGRMYDGSAPLRETSPEADIRASKEIGGGGGVLMFAAGRKKQQQREAAGGASHLPAPPLSRHAQEGAQTQVAPPVEVDADSCKLPSAADDGDNLPKADSRTAESAVQAITAPSLDPIKIPAPSPSSLPSLSHDNCKEVRDLLQLSATDQPRAEKDSGKSPPKTHERNGDSPPTAAKTVEMAVDPVGADTTDAAVITSVINKPQVLEIEQLPPTDHSVSFANGAMDVNDDFDNSTIATKETAPFFAMALFGRDKRNDGSEEESIGLDGGGCGGEVPDPPALGISAHFLSDLAGDVASNPDPSRVERRAPSSTKAKEHPLLLADGNRHTIKACALPASRRRLMDQPGAPPALRAPADGGVTSPVPTSNRDHNAGGGSGNSPRIPPDSASPLTSAELSSRSDEARIAERRNGSDATAFYLQARPPPINTVGPTVYQQVQPHMGAAVTPSPTIQYCIQGGSFGGRDIDRTTLDFDQLFATCVEDVRDGKDRRQTDGISLLESSVELSNVWSKAIVLRGELTSLLEEVEKLHDSLA